MVRTTPMDRNRLQPETVEAVRKAIKATDKTQHRQGRPILSVLLLEAGGQDIEVTPVFWESVEELGLRLPGESDKDCLERLHQQAVDYFKGS